MLLIESLKECQASAIIESEPEKIPTAYLKANNNIFTTTETIPSIIIYFDLISFLFIFLTFIFNLNLTFN